MSLTAKQAQKVLRQRRLAWDTLTGFAQYVDIPGVPIDTDSSDRSFEVVETPLAAHHRLILNVLQLMVEGKLVYDPQALDSPIDFASLRSEMPPLRGRFDGGVPDIQVQAPSPNRTDSQTSPDKHPAPNSLIRIDDGAVEGLKVPKYTGEYPQITGNGTHLSVCRRVMLMLPPGSAKSTYSSVVFPCWYMGRNPNAEVILTGWGDPICERHGKRARQICASPAYSGVFGTGLNPAERSAANWSLLNGSSYKSSGIASGVAGFRCDGLIWDDLTKNRKEADSVTVRNDVFNAYIDDARSRKKPRAWEVGIGCLVGDTEVLLSDGSVKYIRDIEVGDRVVSYEGESEVTNWINHGDDQTYQITTSSGIMVRANERHPFLVERDGELEWVRLRNLEIGDQMVQESGAHTVGWLAKQRAAKNPQNVGRCVPSATESGSGELAGIREPLNSSVNLISSTVTVSRQKITSAWLNLRAGSARFVGNLQRKIQKPIINTVYPLTTAMIPHRYEDCSVTNATSGLVISDTIPTPSEKRWSTCEILAIDAAETENVYDIEVTPHENFVANGLASHNTRWHEDEIMGRILPEGYAGESGFMRCRDGNVWYVICMAAECEREDDPLGREVGEMIWPEWFGEGYWREKRVNPRSWASLYQQRPAPEEGIMFKAEQFKRYTVLPENVNYYLSYDPGVSGEDGDATAIQVWAVDEHSRLYLVDRWVREVTMDVWIDQILVMAKMYKPLEWVSEAGVIRRASEPFVMKAMQKARAFYTTKWVTRHANKQAMARGAEGLVNAGQVYVMEGPEGDAFIDECLRFPAGKEDHQVDAFVNFTLRLEQIWEANPPLDKGDEKVIIKGSFGGEGMKISDIMPPRHVKRKSRWSRKHRLN